MYNENNKLNPPGKSEISSRNNGGNLNNTGLKNNIYFRYLHKLLICILFLSAGLFTSYIAGNQNDIFKTFVSDYFSFYSGNEETGFLYKIYTIMSRDILTFALLILSALTFFYNALGSVLLSANSLIYGICFGILIFSDEPHKSVYLVYIIEAVLILLLFVHIMTRAAKFNEDFISARHNNIQKQDSRIFISREMKRYLKEVTAAVLIYIAVKFISCILLVNL